MSQDNGWGEYSKLVLKELETLASGIEGLRAEISDLKQQLVEMKAREDRVEDLREWKAKIDEIASPSQLRELTNEVESLKLFKTKAVTIFMVVQGIMAAAIALSKAFGS
jgi:predicted  nucleic acid-binding Zn-ribbon protein